MCGKDRRDMGRTVVKRDESANANHATTTRDTIQTRLYSDATLLRRAQKAPDKLDNSIYMSMCTWQASWFAPSMPKVVIAIQQTVT